MLRLALLFFGLALLGALAGATGLAGLSMQIGRMLLIVFLILSVVSLLAGVLNGRLKKYLPK